MAIRDGLAPVSVNFTTSNAEVLPAPALVFFYPGSLQLSVTAIPRAAGCSTLTISPPSIGGAAAIAVRQ